MFKLISKRLIFASLVIILILGFIVTLFINNINEITLNPKKKIKNEGSEKIIGARIHQQNNKGEKFIIIAETMQESKTEVNKIILENSLTTINQNDVLTKISSGHAIVSNDYENFNFSNKVKITKKTREFTLETQSLIGSFKKGNFYTNDKVKIVSGSIRINGTGLDFRRNGEYIKVRGKARLAMLLSKKMKTRKTYILIFYIIFFLYPPFALSKAEPKDKTSQLTVEADESIEWFEKEKYYLAKGNVILKKDGFTLKADFVKAIYFNENGENILTKLTAKKDVFLTKGKAKASGEFITYDLTTKIAVITGPFQTFSSPSGYIESNKLIKFNDLNNKAEAIGKVKIILPNRTKIFGDKVNADFTGKDKALKKATVQGNVIIENAEKGQKSKANLGIYNSSDEIVKLSGNVIIINKKSIFKGSKGMTNLKTGISNLIGNQKKGERVKGVFLPKNK